MDMSLSKFWKTVEDRGAWRATVLGVMKSRTQLSNWTITKARPRGQSMLLKLLPSSFPKSYQVECQHLPGQMWAQTSCFSADTTSPHSCYFTSCAHMCGLEAAQCWYSPSSALLLPCRHEAKFWMGESLWQGCLSGRYGGPQASLPADMTQKHSSLFH